MGNTATLEVGAMSFPIAGSATTPALYPSGSTANALQSNGFIPEIWSGKLVG